MNEQLECILSTEDSPKVCVGDTVNGCEQRCERLASQRKAILQEYKRLVGEYHKHDYLFEQQQDTLDEEIFHHHWLAVTKAHNHMVEYQQKHKITRQELTESTQGIRVGSVAECMNKIDEFFNSRG